MKDFFRGLYWVVALLILIIIVGVLGRLNGEVKVDYVNYRDLERHFILIDEQLFEIDSLLRDKDRDMDLYLKAQRINND